MLTIEIVSDIVCPWCYIGTRRLRAYLASGRDEQLVRDEVAEVQAMGINMVPTFILPNREIIVGAEDPAILAAGIRRALA